MSWYKTFHNVQPVDKIYTFVVNECKADIIRSLYADTTFIVKEEDKINA